MEAAAAAAQFEIGPGPVLRGEAGGEGPRIVLCHGITATHRYVLHGSRTLERSGHRVITFDARGHGCSDPAPAGEGYGYPRLVDDLARVVDAEVGEGRFVLGGHSMGAHTAVAYALRHPDRLAGLLVIGPVYTGTISPASLQYWNGLADALEGGGIDGFLAYIAREQAIDESWRDTVLRFTRARMELHPDLGAIVEALRQVPASQPFSSLEELRQLELPALVVASRDQADPGHPYDVAAAYACRLPQARLIAEGEGESPLAWQGGRLSREIAAFCAEPAVASRLAA
jgi:pimeloyl-ACP methyl ester carboxylesterase